MSMMLASGLASSASLGLRLPIHENSSALGQYRHPWGCVYHYVRIKARVLLGFHAFCSKTKERASAPSRRPAAARTFRRLSAGLDTIMNCILPHGGVFVLFSLESRCYDDFAPFFWKNLGFLVFSSRKPRSARARVMISRLFSRKTREFVPFLLENRGAPARVLFFPRKLLVDGFAFGQYR